ncbi:hypothetical protein LIER_27630 [Lithospermum erythrorhizon]|uniref:Uncharacterized protein n=1 Tax=Lithospermum erythrorhizon TaxID=34254 RepID=A0AAV3RDY1_LITER
MSRRKENQENNYMDFQKNEMMMDNKRMDVDNLEIISKKRDHVDIAFIDQYSENKSSKDCQKLSQTTSQVDDAKQNCAYDHLVTSAANDLDVVNITKASPNIQVHVDAITYQFPTKTADTILNLDRMPFTCTVREKNKNKDQDHVTDGMKTSWEIFRDTPFSEANFILRPFQFKCKDCCSW